MEKINFLEQAFRIYNEQTNPMPQAAMSPTVDHIIVLVEEINQLKKRVIDLENHLKEVNSAL